MQVDEEFPYTTVEESVTNKDWAAGSSKQMDFTEFVLTYDSIVYQGVYKKVRYAPAWWKIIDEPIVNALDHVVRCLNGSNPVTIIKVNFDRNGRVRVYNNGTGVKVEIHKTASAKLNRTIWLPTFIFGMLFQGSNQKRPDDSIIGGTNGLGAKLSNCFSTDFIVETYDAVGKKYFIQRWLKNMTIAEEPTIVDSENKQKIDPSRFHSHTTLSFQPDYIGLFGYSSFGDTEYNELIDIVRFRVALASVYAHTTVGYTKTKKGFKDRISVYFNDVLMNFRSITDIANVLFPGAPTFTTTVVPIVDPKAPSRQHFKHPWEVCSVVVPNTYDYLTIVNGIMVRDGKHIKYINNLITESVQEKIAKSLNEKDVKFSSSHISANVFTLINAKIPNPSWTGQRKDTLDIDIRKLHGYTLDTKFTNALGEHLQASIVEVMFSKQTTRSKTTKYEKYQPAIKCNTKQSLKCTLIAVEGDSAMTQACIGISNNMGFDYFGVISLGGVIMNVRKQSSVTETATGKYVKTSVKMEKNVLIKALCDVIGLNLSYKYDPSSPTYKKEMSELHYGCIWGFVDQDLDGTGAILGLLINAFHHLWPLLYSAGFVKWPETPIKRAFPRAGGKVVEFYNEPAYQKWAETANVSKYTINYYKGIGTHTRDQIIHIFKHIQSHLYTYFLDSRSDKLFETYFGTDPSLRKIELAKPTAQRSVENILLKEETKMISCSDHLETETNLYQKDNLDRKLDHVIDGQNQAGRKILDGLFRAFGNTNPQIKIASLSGSISKDENYHHGEASLQDSLTNRGFITPGGKQLPLIRPFGNFGSRKGGGWDASPARYIFAKLNKQLIELIFPPVDYDLLQFHEDGGTIYEPKYFVPTIPMAIIESTEVPAHGWKLKTWGRDVFAVIANVRRLIRLGDDAPLLKMPPCTYKGSPYEWTGTIKSIRGDVYSFGKYLVVNSTTLKITELPLRVWTNDYTKKIRAKQLAEEANGVYIIKEISDVSDDLSVNIHIELYPGAIEVLSKYADSYFADGVEEYFQLRDRMDSHLNLMSPDGSVLELSTYEEAIIKWFPTRKEFYSLRVSRQIIILRLKITYLRNLVRYISTTTQQMSKLKRAEMLKVLVAEKYDRFYRARLFDPGRMQTNELETILNGDKSTYEYLLSISDADKSEEDIAELEQKINTLTNELHALEEKIALGRFRGAAVWEDELDQIEQSIREGQRTFWQYEDYGKFEY